MLDQMTNKRVVIGLIIARIITGIIAMPATSSNGAATYTPIDNLFRLISTLLMVLILVIALHALGNMKKNKDDKDEN